MPRAKKVVVTHEDRQRRDAMRYRALRLTHIFPNVIDTEADRLLEKLREDGVVLDADSVSPAGAMANDDELPAAPTRRRKTRKWSKARRAAQEAMLAKKKKEKERSPTMQLIHSAGKRTADEQ